MREVVLSQLVLAILAYHGARGGVIFGERIDLQCLTAESDRVDCVIAFFTGEPPSFTTELEDAFVFERDAAGNPARPAAPHPPTSHGERDMPALGYMLCTELDHRY